MMYVCTDYIHDNCEGGRTERLNFHCHVLLKPDTYRNLRSTCDAMRGQLTWFDTWQEHEALMGRLWYYNQAAFNDHLYTGSSTPFASSTQICTMRIIHRALHGSSV